MAHMHTDVTNHVLYILCTAVAVTCSHLFYIIHLSVYHVRTFVQVNIVADFIQLLKFLNTPLDKMYVM